MKRIAHIKRSDWFAAAYFGAFLLSVVMCFLRFGVAEVMLLCVSGFAQILHCVERGGDDTPWSGNDTERH